MSGGAVFEFGRFSRRHIGPQPAEISAMLETVAAPTLEALIEQTVPAGIRSSRPLDLPAARTEEQALADLAAIAGENQIFQSCIGMGYHACHTPAVIRRNILENPGWYTAYTPYQAEIAQGRLEALLNFQTMVCDLTAMEIANASLLDEATAAAEAMVMAQQAGKGAKFFVADDCHPQTIALLRTRAEPLGIEIVVGRITEFPDDCFGALIQYPATDGRIRPLRPLIEAIHAAGALAVVSADLLALTLIEAPGECGADIAIGSSQRFGVPLGYGGPHAAYLATRDAHKRRMPGRLIGVSRDAEGDPALRLTLQTREQHIRREKATSNICTAQVLLAVIASMYAVYHGPGGLTAIAQRVHRKALALANLLRGLGWTVDEGPFFDTICVRLGSVQSFEILRLAESYRINLRALDEHTVTIALDETTGSLAAFGEIFNHGNPAAFEEEPGAEDFGALARTSAFLTHPIFNRYHTETELMRYLKRLEAKDLSLTTSMIPLGSCTMKLNAAAEMTPVTWEKIGALHPFAPTQQAEGYQRMFAQLESWLAEITGFAACSLQPNAGSQGEYAGLLAIRAYHLSQGSTARTVCLIPTSAHGTNPASAAMAGMGVVPVACDAQGNIDVADLRAKVATHAEKLAALMVTYPSTHGVYEESIREICEIVHAAGGQVYMDGANMNAQVGLCQPGAIGADVCHLNLHKTFCIPHGGGGPGVGPIAVAAHLAPFLPGHSVIATGGERAIGEVSQAPWGSASIDVISWMYIAMMGPDGLTEATKIAILNANYVASRLGAYFPVLYQGANGRVAHECILDVREWKDRAGVEVEDFAKRLMDFGFHAPTMSWPVPGTLMIEPTESESKAELDRFCEAMITIHGELAAIEKGELDRANNPLKRAPHTARQVTADGWDRPYSRERAAYPAPWLREHKFWPAVARIDNVYGDRNIFCTCPSIDELA